MTRLLRPLSQTAAASVLVLGLAACSGLDTTAERTLSGGAIGAGVGAVGTVITGGCIACGAAVGGVVGAGTGYLYDQVKKGNL